ALTEPIEDTATKIHSLHTEHQYKCRIRAQNLAGLGEPLNSTKENKMRESIIDEKRWFIQELEPVTIINERNVILTVRLKHDLASEFK
ncbi:unnamed protein product, partial [Rotaria sordida]